LSNGPAQDKIAVWAVNILHFAFQFHKLHQSKMG